MISNQTEPRFHEAIANIIEKTSIVSLLAASADEWPIWKPTIGKLLVENEVNLTLAWQWIDKTPDAQRMLHDVVQEWASFEPISETVDFPDVKAAIAGFCLAKCLDISHEKLMDASGDIVADLCTPENLSVSPESITPEAQAFFSLAEAFG